MMLVQIRYNTASKKEDELWRVIVDGTEYKCGHVEINTKCFTSKDEVFDSDLQKKIFKYHISCEAKTVKFVEDKVIIY